MSCVRLTRLMLITGGHETVCLRFVSYGQRGGEGRGERRRKGFLIMNQSENYHETLSLSLFLNWSDRKRMIMS